MTADVLLPVEPLYEPEVAASLIPCSRKSLMSMLQRHKGELGEPYFRIWRGHRYRLISASEIRWLRDKLIRRRPSRDWQEWKATRETRRAKYLASQAPPPPSQAPSSRSDVNGSSG